MSYNETAIATNRLNPATLSFCLGAVARFAKSELTIPKDIYAAIAIPLGYISGLSLGGTAVLATMAASASYIAAPPAVRATLPNANPAYYLTLALAITFPFNIVLGIPIYFSLSDIFLLL
jgi:hypothetical protein